MSKLTRNIEALVESSNLSSLLSILGDSKGKDALVYGKLLAKLSSAMDVSLSISSFEYKKDIQDIFNSVSQIAKSKGDDFFNAVNMAYKNAKKDEK
jgi:hypothetical protein